MTKLPKPLPGAKPDDTRVQMTIRVPPDIRRTLKVKAARENRSMDSIVNEIIGQYLCPKTERSDGH
jgi:plasmid stability protein